MERTLRFESTRRKLRLARYAVIGGSTAAASQSSVYGHGDDGSYSDDSQTQSFGYGSSSLSPSTNGAPVVQSSGS